MSHTQIEEPSTPEALYLELLKKCLTRYVFGEPFRAVESPGRIPWWPLSAKIRWGLYAQIRKWLASRQLVLVYRMPFDPDRRAEGHDWPLEAETMVGLKRLDNLQYCITDVLRQGVPGDLIETGVWRGGATIFMRAVLKIYGDTERIVWVADSFRGLPKPDPERYPADAGDLLWTQTRLSVSLEEVKANFTRYGLLDDQVRFLVGWFRDTLPGVRIDRLSVLRLDGDLYESTMDALRYLYPKLSVGGYVIVDDYGGVPACRAAVEDFRAKDGITEEVKRIDYTGAFWQRLR